MATATGLKRRRLVFSSFDQLYAEIDLLETGGYAMAGRWTLTQICEHLRLAMHMSMHGFGGLKVPLVMRLFGKVALYNVLGTQRMPAGFKAPKPFMPEVAAAEDAAVIERCRQTAAEFENFTGELHPSPLFGTLTKERWARVHLIHAAHHLGFLIPAGPAGV